MSRSFDLWFDYLKVLVTTTIPDPANLDDTSDILDQTDWEDHFGSSLRVYERKHPFPGLLVNYDDSNVANNYNDGSNSDNDDVDRSPNWLSQMFEYGFIRLIKLTSPDQASQLPQIIQTAITKFESPYVSIRCWSTLPNWEKDNWMNVQPSKHLVLINGYTHQGQWYEGDSYLSFSNPYALAECWRHYFSNQILDVTQNLWKDYHFMGSTERIYVFGPRPYANAISHIRIIDYCNPSSFLTRGKTPEFEPLLYCGFCNQHTTYQDHACNDDPPWDTDNSYPSDASD